MGFERNTAYAGTAAMPNGGTVCVFYMDRAALREAFGYQPPGHPARKRIGWYWRHAAHVMGANVVLHHGPFTSSRLAMMDALDKNKAAAS